MSRRESSPKKKGTVERDNAEGFACSVGEKSRHGHKQRIANRLETEHPAGLREATTLHRTCNEAAKSIAADKKLLTSQAWTHKRKWPNKNLTIPKARAYPSGDQSDDHAHLP
jgi:hypothetical protein